jgi:hypothetical protein
MRTFLERRLFGPGDRVFTWALMAGIAWLVVAVSSVLFAVGLVATVWYGAIGLAVGLFGACPSIWFARHLLVLRSAFWTAVGAIYALTVVVGLLIYGPSIGGSELDALVAMVPAVLSALAVWEIRRGPQR